MNDHTSDESRGVDPEETSASNRYENDPAYRGKGFDPTGDEAVEKADEREPSSFAERVEHILDREAELFDRRPRSAMHGGRPDDDLSDLVEGQIEGVYAEQIGFPEVTQDVDAEEAAYLEENAAYARERVLEETHDEPDADGYTSRHLASAVRRVEEERATDPDWPEPESAAPSRDDSASASGAGPANGSGDDPMSASDDVSENASRSDSMRATDIDPVEGSRDDGAA